MIAEKGGGASVEMQNDQPTRSKTLKEKTTKAERRAQQEAQRAAKAAAKGDFFFNFVIFFLFLISDTVLPC